MSGVTYLQKTLTKLRQQRDEGILNAEQYRQACMAAVSSAPDLEETYEQSDNTPGTMLTLNPENKNTPGMLRRNVASANSTSNNGAVNIASDSKAFDESSSMKNRSNAKNVNKQADMVEITIHAGDGHGGGSVMVEARQAESSLAPVEQRLKVKKHLPGSKQVLYAVGFAILVIVITVVVLVHSHHSEGKEYI
mmetsp:Transcript_34469/g.47757  ORF Transcript_34469/g.47757 Transcript_34469/m.47757 type:complete len:193 (-) Transcript_34469:260-838(-)|eukprot:CAMPEP_0196584028 /NCGR_PEP_ID=MMETSP1081-20130531/45511_1 /TAXON_ID=36882 /ORGANISM="Pyramimonas amylifera, Strain CCMP720" /LENGTH=192 /DNA_ID=CAMNT_0041905101 /DNA_START=184 /DNA_END=762 /DNA_ORIENTATION=-